MTQRTEFSFSRFLHPLMQLCSSNVTLPRSAAAMFEQVPSLPQFMGQSLSPTNLCPLSRAKPMTACPIHIQQESVFWQPKNLIPNAQNVCRHSGKNLAWEEGRIGGIDWECRHQVWLGDGGLRPLQSPHYDSETDLSDSVFDGYLRTCLPSTL